MERIPVYLTIALLGFMILFGFTGCGRDNAFSTLDQNQEFIQEAPLADDPTDASCKVDSFRQPTAPAAQKLDLLFVTDTSQSLDNERAAAADAVNQLVSKFPSGTDFNIGVLLGHGGSLWSGNLYRSTASEPVVLKSTSLSLDQIQTHLKKKLTSAPDESATDGGEAGLVSLQKATSDVYLVQSRGQGFFRLDAALVVVFIADENDICVPGIITDPQGNEIKGQAAYCNNSTTPGAVFAQLKSLQGSRPLMIGGILYDGTHTVPRDGENELGYGYMDLIRLSNGVTADLAAPNTIADKLAVIGDYVGSRLNLITQRKLAGSSSVVDATSIQVKVDGANATFEYVLSTNTVNLKQPGQANSLVEIRYCAKSGMSFGVGESAPVFVPPKL